MLALHIVDVLFICGEDFRQHSYNLRMDTARLFVTAITKPSRTNLTPIRVKTLYKVEELPDILSQRCNYRSPIITTYIAVKRNIVEVKCY